MLDLNRVRRSAAEALRCARIGLALSAHTVGVRSKLTVVLFGASAVLKQNTRWALTGVPVTVSIGGRAFPVRLALRTDLDILREILISGEYGLASGVSGTIVDLGANVGLATLSLLAANPGTSVIAVEADPRLIPLLRANAADHPVTVVHRAVGAHPGERTFFHSIKLAWGSGLSRTAPEQHAVQVPGVTFAGLLDELRVTDVALLKLDIEGAEWETFPAGMDPRVQAVVGELHRASDGDPELDIGRFLGPGWAFDEVRRDAERVVFSARRAPVDRTPASGCAPSDAGPRG